MIVAGIGCRRGTPPAAIRAVIEAALARARLGAGTLDAIATTAAKVDEPGVAAAAVALGVRLLWVPQAALACADGRAVTRSQRVVARMGVGSVAEAAALAAGGPGARLILPRIILGPATCALAGTDLGAWRTWQHDGLGSMTDSAS